MRLALLLCALPLAAISAQSVRLFDGRSLDGWTVHAKPADQTKAFWSVRDGAITCDSIGRPDHDYVWLMYTAREFDDFVLRLKVRSYSDSPGNSGVQFRSRYDAAAQWLDGPQADLHPPAPWRSGLIYDETRGAQRWIFPSLADWRIERAQGPEQFAWRHAPEWNDVEIRADGFQITTTVNGHRIADFDATAVLDDAAHRARNAGRHGFIALQLHSKDETRIQFKDIEVVPLAPWRSLFDGSTTNGWLEVTGAPFPASWAVEDGCLVAKPGEGGIQDIRTAESFRSFEFEWEWKIAPGGNSGVKYLVHKTDRWDAHTGSGYHARARGLEYQLADDATNKDAAARAESRSAGLYGIFAPAALAARPVGEFNRSRIVVDHGHVEHWLNGQRTAEFELRALDTKRFPTRDVIASPVSLQNHNSLVWFRNLRIRPLD